MVLTRVLPLPQMGTYAAVQAITMILTFVSSAALPTAVTRDVSRKISEGNRSGANGVTELTIKFVATISITIVIVFLLIFQLVQSHIFGIGFDWVIWAIAIDVPLLAVSMILSAYLQGGNRFGRLAVITLAGSFIKYIIGAIFAFLTGRIEIPIIIVVLGDMIVTFSLLATFFRNSVKDGRSKNKDITLRTLLRYSTPLVIPFLVSNLSKELERVFALVYIGLISLAIYNLSVTIVIAISIIYTSISGAIFPNLVEIMEKEGIPSLCERIPVISRLVAIVYLPIAGVIITLGQIPFLWVFGNSYANSYPLLIVMIIGSMISCFSVAVVPIALAIGETKIIGVSAILGFVSFILSFIVITFLLGLPLFALATSRSILFIVSFLTTFGWLQYKHNGHIDIYSILKIGFGVICASLVSTIWIILSQQWWAQISAIFTFVGIYILILRVFNTVLERDLKVLTSFLPSSIRSRIYQLLARILLR